MDTGTLSLSFSLTHTYTPTHSDAWHTNSNIPSNVHRSPCAHPVMRLFLTAWLYWRRWLNPFGINWLQRMFSCLYLRVLSSQRRAVRRVGFVLFKRTMSVNQKRPWWSTEPAYSDKPKHGADKRGSTMLERWLRCFGSVTVAFCIMWPQSGYVLSSGISSESSICIFVSLCGLNCVLLSPNRQHITPSAWLSCFYSTALR